MSYLVIKSASNATPESYLLTSTTNGPRLAVNGSYIPLSTDMGGGSYEVKVNDGNTTYHVMRTSTSSYSQSASASATFNTTNADGSGLSNTTALTRVSTSNTVYYTAGETTGTTYLTRQSVSGYATRESVSGYATRQSVSGYGTASWATATYTRASTSATAPATQPTAVTTIHATNVRAQNIYTSSSFYTQMMTTSNTKISFTTYSGTYQCISSARNYNGSVTHYRSTQSSLAMTTIDTYYMTRSDSNSLFFSLTGKSSLTYYSTYVIDSILTTGTIYYTRESIYGYGYGTFTTATYTRASTSATLTRASTSATLTRASTSGTNYGTRVITTNTVYLTRESTSGYSGVSTSSSSSSESASGTCWK